MAQLLNNAWAYGHSDTDFDRNTGSSSVNLVPVIDAQSSHNAFSITNTHAITWSLQGRYFFDVHSESFDGDDNEEGWSCFLIDFGVTGAQTQDVSSKVMGPVFWNQLNSTHPDRPGVVTGRWDGMNADSSACTLVLKYQTYTTVNASQTSNPFWYWAIKHL